MAKKKRCRSVAALAEVTIRARRADPFHAARRLHVERDNERDGEAEGGEKEIHDHGRREWNGGLEASGRHGQRGCDLMLPLYPSPPPAAISRALIRMSALLLQSPPFPRSATPMPMFVLRTLVPGQARLFIGVGQAGAGAIADAVGSWETRGMPRFTPNFPPAFGSFRSKTPSNVRNTNIRFPHRPSLSVPTYLKPVSHFPRPFR